MGERGEDVRTDAVLPDVIPLFPLPDLAVFPRVPLPLHVFEPRYRALVEDLGAEGGGRWVGSCILRPGWEGEYEGRPPVFPVGCAGLLEHVESLPDGRYDVLLRGVTRFRVLEELPGKPYRLARVAALPDLPADDPGALEAARKRLLAAIGRASDGPVVLVLQAPLPPDLFVNALCQSLTLSGLERQSLLDCAGPSDRCARLLEIMEFRALEGTLPSGSRTIH